MPKVISTLDLRRKLGQHVKEIQGYTIVANETFKDRTFLIVEPDMMMGLLIEAGFPKEAGELNNAIRDISAKVSTKYRDMVNQRHKLYD
jgi:hypothetical protein